MNALRAIPPRSAAALAACALLVLAFAPAMYFGHQQDDVLYMIGARALAMGRYCLLTDPACPPLTMINPLWPAALAPLAWLTESTGPLQAASALVLAAVPLALWAWLRRRAGETNALLAAGLFASSPHVLAQSGAVMSEAPFTLALLAMLAAAEAGKALPAGLAAAALLLTRTAGVASLPALAPFLRHRDRATATLRAFMPPLLAFGAWSAWSWRASGAVDKFSMFSHTYGEHWLAKLIRVAVSNTRFYATELGGCFTPPRLAAGPLALLIGFALAGVALRGLVLSLRRRADEPAAWALAGTTAMLAVWGWQYDRYLLPLLPLILWALAEGLGRRAERVLAALLVMQLGFQTLPRLGRPGPHDEPQLRGTYAWLSALPAPQLLVSAEPTRDGWLAGLPSRPFPLTGTDEEFAAALKTWRATVVLRVEGQDYGLEADPSAAPRVQLEEIYRRLENPRLFRKLHEVPAERATLYAPR